MYRTGRARGLSPSEFWGLTMAEFAIEVQDRIANSPDAIGMTPRKMDAILEQDRAFRAKLARIKAQKETADGA